MNNLGKKAFTLIEVIFYTVLFSIIIVGMFNMAVFLSEQSQSVVEKNQMITEASLVFDEVIRVMKMGQAINDVNSTFEQNFSIIEYTDSVGSTVKFEVDNGVLKKTVDGVTTNMHSDDITVSRFYLKKYNQSNSIPLVNVAMIFVNDFGHSFSLNTTINFIYE